MNIPSRSAGWVFSLGAHALLLGGVLILARDVVYVEPQSYRVSLAAGLHAPKGDVARPAPAEEQSAPPPPTPAQAQQASPKQPAPSVARAEPKKISPRKRELADVPKSPDRALPTKANPPSVVSPPSVPASGEQADNAGPSGPQPHQIDGLSAYEYSALDQRPSVTRRADPEYPAKARRMSVQGAVVVQLVVDATGQPRNCTVVRATPNGFFEEAALAAARQMRFVPGKIKGQPVNTLVQLPFSFKLQ